MERRFDVHFRVSYEPRVMRPWLALAAVLLCAGELASENVTLTTYYPAPSGMYTQMIVTGNTWLARNGGNVGIGTGAAAVNARLDVAGQANIQKLLTTGNNIYSTADPKAADITVGSDTGTRHDSSIMFWSNSSAARIFGQSDNFYLSPWNQDAVTGANVKLAATSGGSSYFKGNLGVSGAAPGSQPYMYVKASGASCSTLSTNGSPSVVCSGGYVTWAAGLYVDGQWWYTGPAVRIGTQATSLGPQVYVTQSAPTYYCCTK